MATKVIKAENKNKKKIEQVVTVQPVSLESQERLAEILNDSPRLISLKGTEWEIRALRMGTQNLIAEKVIKINKAQSATFGDIINQFATNMPAIVEVITLALLNDKNKIFKDGNPKGEYSETYHATYETLMWECNVETFGEILFNVLEMLDVSFFEDSHRILEIFRESTMMRRTKTLGQKQSMQ